MEENKVLEIIENLESLTVEAIEEFTNNRGEE